MSAWPSASPFGKYLSAVFLLIATECDCAVDAVNAIRMLVKAIVTQFVVDKQNNDQAGSNADRESQNINKRKKALLAQRAERQGHIIFQHIRCCLIFYLKGLFLHFEKTGCVAECFQHSMVSFDKIFSPLHFRFHRRTDMINDFVLTTFEDNSPIVQVF